MLSNQRNPMGEDEENGVFDSNLKSAFEGYANVGTLSWSTRERRVGAGHSICIF